jgi:hypothetical protein
MDKTPDAEPVDTGRFSASWRLTFRFDQDGAVELAGQEELPMIAPGSAVPPSSGGQHSGAWVALQDGQGRVLFDRVLHDPFQTRVEVHHPPGPESRVARRESRVVTGRREPGEFEVVVPAMPEATTVAVWSSPLEAGRRNEPAREIGRFDLGTRRARTGR